MQWLPSKSLTWEHWCMYMCAWIIHYVRTNFQQLRVNMSMVHVQLSLSATWIRYRFAFLTCHRPPGGYLFEPP